MVGTGQDRTRWGQDRIEIGGDRTGQDRTGQGQVGTGQERTRWGQDRILIKLIDLIVYKTQLLPYLCFAIVTQFRKMLVS